MKKRIGLINDLFAADRRRTTYLEIGCHRNATFSRIKAPVKIGVDPVQGGTHRMTSTDFFAVWRGKADVIFIDGLHHASQVLGDVTNALWHLSSHGVIVIHDCLPTAKEHQDIVDGKGELIKTLPPDGTIWNGDVWRAMLWIRSWPHVDSATVDIDEGLGVVVPRKNRQPTMAVTPAEASFDTFDEFREKFRLLPTVSDAVKFCTGGGW